MSHAGCGWEPNLYQTRHFSRVHQAREEQNSNHKHYSLSIGIRKKKLLLFDVLMSLFDSSASIPSAHINSHLIGTIENRITICNKLIIGLRAKFTRIYRNVVRYNCISLSIIINYYSVREVVPKYTYRPSKTCNINYKINTYFTFFVLLMPVCFVWCVQLLLFIYPLIFAAITQLQQPTN